MEVWKTSFGRAATNREIVKEVHDFLKAHPPRGGHALLINGPASLPVAFVVCHAVAHLFATIGIWDPKLVGYVVVVSHSPDPED